MSHEPKSEPIKENEISQNQLPPKDKTKNKFRNVIREILAWICWIYTIIKLFIFDIDIYLLDRILPSYAWIINYKFLMLIGLLSIVFLLTKNIDIILWALFIIFYPIIFILWRIPSFLYKKGDWNYALAFFDSVISFFKTTKLRLFKTTIFLILFVIILSSSNKNYLWISVCLVFLVLISVYYEKFNQVFKPSSVYNFYFTVASKIGSFLKTDPKSPSVNEMREKSLEKMNEKEITLWTSTVQMLVLYNRGCLFFAKKLRLYQKSKLIALASLLSFIFLFLFTVISFALINFGLFKISNDYFNIAKIPTLFNFIFYSFNALFSNSIIEISPSNPISQTIFMAELFFTFLLGTFLFNLLYSIKNSRQKEELDELIRKLTKEGEEMESFILNNYRFSNIYDVMEALKKLKAAFVEILYKMTETIK